VFGTACENLRAITAIRLRGTVGGKNDTPAYKRRNKTAVTSTELSPIIPDAMSQSKSQVTSTSTQASSSAGNTENSSGAPTATSTSTSTTAVPIFSKAWFTHGRIAIMGLIGLGTVMLLSYGWWWLQGATRRLPPFQARDEDSEEHRVVCYAERESGGSFLSLPLGTFHIATLSLERMGSIRVPAGMLVEIHSIHTLAPKVASVAENGTEQPTKNGNTEKDQATTTAASLVSPPPGFEWRLAPPPTRCLPGMVTDVSQIDWTAAQRLSVRRATNDEYSSGRAV
jgi:hypothetical protein